MRHRLVEPQTVAQQYACAAKRDPKVTDQFPDERVQSFRIWFTHYSLLW
jgi:hypothetical protein